MINIDSTAVNTAITKIDSLVKLAAPKLQEGGMALVDYNILLFICKQAWSFAPFLFVLIVSAIYMKKSLTKPEGIDGYSYLDPDSRDFILPKFIIIITSGIGLFIGIIATLCNVPNVPKIIIALKHPVIFTILELMKK